MSVRVIRCHHNMGRLVDLLKRQSPGTTVAMLATYWGVAYMITNHFPPRSPAFLPFLPYEGAIPFVGWTILIYLSAFPQGACVAWLLDRETLARGVAAAFGAVTAHVLIFIAFPTTYPRPVVPVATAPVIRYLYNSLRFADSPGNCFPSLHVSMTFLLTMVLWRCRPRLGGLSLAWSLLIVISTLTTKQHYAFDAFGGLVIALAAYRLVFNQESN